MSADYLERLGRAHGFSVDELRSNLQGTLHPAQSARLRRKGRIAAVVLAVLGLLALAGGILGGDAYQGSYMASDTTIKEATQIRWAGVTLGGFFLLCAGVSVRRRRRRNARYALGQVEVEQGPLHKVHVQGRGGVPDRYRFRVGGRAFDTLETGWDLLTEGAIYRMHCIGDELLSLVPVPYDLAARDEALREREQFERTRHIKPSRLVQ